MSRAGGSGTTRARVATALALVVACRSHPMLEAPNARESAAPATLSAAEVESVSCEGDSMCALISFVRDTAGDPGGRYVSLVEHTCGAFDNRLAYDRAIAMWLLAGGPGTLHRVQLLSDRCAPRARPTISVIGPGLIREVQPDEMKPRATALSGKDVPFAWTISDFALDPPRALRQTQVRDEGDIGMREETWDFEVAHARVCRRQSPDAPCLATAAPPSLLTVADPTFAAGAWKTVSLGQCATVLDESNRDRLAAEVDVPTNTVVRALLTDWEMYLEVSDDSFVVAGKAVDALDVAAYSGVEGTPRLDFELLMDGRVSAGPFGAPRVEMVSVTPTLRRFKLSGNAIRWGEKVNIDYFDTADGVTRRAVLKSGDLDLSELHRVLPQKAVCVPEGGSLRVRPTPRAATEALAW